MAQHQQTHQHAHQQHLHHAHQHAQHALSQAHSQQLQHPLATAQQQQQHHIGAQQQQQQAFTTTFAAGPSTVQVQNVPGGGMTSPGPGMMAGGPLVATGDWTKDLVQLAKTAELKKHALTLQLHTAHILSAHASLDQRSKALQDIMEQKNKLNSERNRLLNCLREINEDRDKVDLMEASIDKECNDLRLKITTLTEGEYAVSKQEVDRLRQELGQPPLPSLQATLDEKSSEYLNERRLSAGAGIGMTSAGSGTGAGASGAKRGGVEAVAGKRPRGRPKGSKNRAKVGSAGTTGGPVLE